jgi:hypothetical protein
MKLNGFALEWRGAISGAALVALVTLGWNVWRAREIDNADLHRSDLSSAAWRAIVDQHLAETEPIKDDYLKTRQQVALNSQAIGVIQTGMASMQEDLRAIRDYIYGQRPREPQTRRSSP